MTTIVEQVVAMLLGVVLSTLMFRLIAGTWPWQSGPWRPKP